MSSSYGDICGGFAVVGRCMRFSSQSRAEAETCHPANFSQSSELRDKAQLLLSPPVYGLAA